LSKTEEYENDGGAKGANDLASEAPGSDCDQLDELNTENVAHRRSEKKTTVLKKFRARTSFMPISGGEDLLYAPLLYRTSLQGKLNDKRGGILIVRLHLSLMEVTGPT
jgi:hypothetical protein